MKLNSEIKIREEDGFYLVINLSSESILKGFPSFFKINQQGYDIIKMIEVGMTREEIYSDLEGKGLDREKDQGEVEKFFQFLERFDITYE